MKKSRKILITGNHHTPAIELIHELQADEKYNWKIYYIAHQFKTETHLLKTIKDFNVNYYELHSGKYNRHRFLPNLWAPILVVLSIFKSFKILQSVRPNIVVSFGGYTSVPVIISAWLLKIKSITHEQTLTISLSTKINSFFVNKVALSFENNQKPSPKYIVTGNLIRQEIFQTKKSGFDSITTNKPLIYITGGSQGSLFINQLIFDNLEHLKRYQILHQTGLKDLNKAKELSDIYPNYHPVDYVDSKNIGWVFHQADLIISRSGANTCQEIDLLDKKAIIIPLPYTQQHEQELNSKWLHQRHPHSIQVFDQFSLVKDDFIKAVDKLINLNHLQQPKSINHPHPLLKLLHETV